MGSTVALGFAAVNVAFFHLDMCVDRKKMSVTLQSTAMGPQASAQRTLTSKMEPLASTKVFVSGRGADQDICSAKAFLDPMPRRHLIVAMM
jgi:hypothetical protein